MKMKLHKVGTDKRDGTVEVTLVGSVEDIRSLRDLVGTEVDADIRPHLRFKIGDSVRYASVTTDAPAPAVHQVEDGPFVVGGTLCWKISGQRSVVSDDSLHPVAA